MEGRDQMEGQDGLEGRDGVVYGSAGLVLQGPWARGPLSFKDEGTWARVHDMRPPDPCSHRTRPLSFEDRASWARVYEAPTPALIVPGPRPGLGSRGPGPRPRCFRIPPRRRVCVCVLESGEGGPARRLMQHSGPRRIDPFRSPPDPF